MTKKNEAQQKAFDNIVQTWNGGERKLAGARASELIYGAGNKPNEAIQDELLEALPGINDYIVAPVTGMAVDTVQDHGQEPLQTPANLSSEEAKQERNAVDDTLAPGREVREAKREPNADTVGDTALNPPENLPGQFDPLDHDHDGRKGGNIANRGKSAKK